MTTGQDSDGGTRRRYARLLGRAWADDAFRQRLMSDPASVLREYGVEIPEGVQVRAVEQPGAEDTDTVKYIVVPPRPAGPLTDQLLDEAAGATWNRGSTPMSTGRPGMPMSTGRNGPGGNGH